MNFEQLRFQIHIRGLYERLGPAAAEDLIARAWLVEQARSDKIHHRPPAQDNRVRPAIAK